MLAPGFGCPWLYSLIFRLRVAFSGALARGDAKLFMRFPAASYREKIWDHCAGAIIVQEAGGAISDAAGARLLCLMCDWESIALNSVCLSPVPCREVCSCLDPACTLNTAMVCIIDCHHCCCLPPCHCKMRLRCWCAAGAPLDFSKGRWLDLHRGIVAAPPTVHTAVLQAIQNMEQ